jgi:hypothetical protein
VLLTKKQPAAHQVIVSIGEGSGGWADRTVDMGAEHKPLVDGRDFLI